MTRRSPQHISKGSRLYPGSLFFRTVVALDDVMHGEVRAIAQKRNVSFAQVVRELIEIGLESVEQPAPPKKIST